MKDKRNNRKGLGDYMPDSVRSKRGLSLNQVEDLLKRFSAGDGGAFNFGELNEADFAFWSGQNKDLSKAFELVVEDVQNRILDVESKLIDVETKQDKILVCLEKILERDNLGRGMDEVARLLHYPGCWDTMAYPTLADALYESTNGFDRVCTTCLEAVEDKEKEAKNDSG